MRKLYFIRQNEEDGRLLDALIAAGCSTDDSDLCNPSCPVCGSSVLPAYSANGKLTVVTGSELAANEGAGADAWFLVCSQLECSYEEEFEHVADPGGGAVIFDLNESNWDFEEYLGLTIRCQSDLLDLIHHLRALLDGGPNRKLLYFLEDAKWRYNDQVEETRNWADMVPPGKLVSFRIGYDEILGTFLTATNAGFMVLTEPNCELLTVRAEEPHGLLPGWPDREDLPASKLGSAAPEPGPGVRANGLIMLYLGRQMVVVRGWHLHFSMVDRLGQYLVDCWDRDAALALGLKQTADNHWQGAFRRAEIEARYDLKKMVKVKGHWVEVYGEREKCPAVRTSDPAVAAALNLREDAPHSLYHYDGRPRHFMPTWRGVIPETDIEDCTEVKVHHWPLPEFQLPDTR